MATAVNLKSALAAADTKIEPLRKAWFTALVSLLLFAALATPGLASSQVAEAMLSYVVDTDTPWTGFNWLTAYITLFAFMTVGRALRHWTARLLGCKPSELAAQSDGIRLFVTLIWLAPWAGLALVFLQAAINLGGQWLSPFIFLMALSIAIPAVFYLAPKHPRLREIYKRFDGDRRIQLALDIIPIALFVLGVILLSIPGAALFLSRLAGPPAILALALSAFVSFCGWAFVTGRRLRLPVFWGAAAFALIFSLGDCNDNHPIRSLPGEVAVAPDGPVTTLARWADLKGNPTRPIIIVSAEGGGIRAAYFTAITLARIADRCPAAADRIFAINGVSGGSVGAALYAAAVHAWPLYTTPEEKAEKLSTCDFSDTRPGKYERALHDVLRQDHLSPILARFLFSDTVQRFLPFPIDALDRQVAFEEGLTAAFAERFKKKPSNGSAASDPSPQTDGPEPETPAPADAFARSIYEIVPDAVHPSTPYLLLNTTSVQTGERVVAGNILFASEQNIPNTRSFASILPGTNFSLATLAATSARFPYLSPSGYLRTADGKERFVDGGYFDNSGASTLIDLFTALTDEHALQKAGLEKAPILAIHIGNNPICKPDKTPPEDMEPSQAWKRSCKPPEPFWGLDEQIAPILAVLSSREGRVSWTLETLETSFRRSSTQPASGAAAPAPGEDARLTAARQADATLLRVQMLDNGTPIPLGWLLSARAATEMRDQLMLMDRSELCENPRDRPNACTFADVAFLFSPEALAMFDGPGAVTTTPDPQQPTGKPPGIDLPIAEWRRAMEIEGPFGSIIRAPMLRLEERLSLPAPQPQ